uniref:Putative secreted peptide n=1 Tax=Anopheles braziliensis TaxID=58242 RepID=A0A2M3ZSW5_9DIPT
MVVEPRLVLALVAVPVSVVTWETLAFHRHGARQRRTSTVAQIHGAHPGRLPAVAAICGHRWMGPVSVVPHRISTHSFQRACLAVNSIKSASLRVR